MRADQYFRQIKQSRLVATTTATNTLSTQEDLKQRAKVLDRMVAAKAERRNIQMLTPSRLVKWSRVENNSTIPVQNNRIPLATSPRFFQGRQEPVVLDNSRAKMVTVMGGGSSKHQTYANPIRSIYIKPNNPNRINLAEFEPTWSRTTKNDVGRPPIKTFAGTPSETKSRSCSKQKIALSNKSKSMNFNCPDQTNNWLDPLIGLFSGSSSSIDGCECAQPCRWATMFVRWSLVDSPKDRSKYYQSLKSVGVEADAEVQIEKDAKRTQPEVATFTTVKYQTMLKEILANYSKYDPEIGYVQGMNVILSGLLYHIKEEEPTFWVFAKLMKRLEIRTLYLKSISNSDADFEVVYLHVAVIRKCLEMNINDLYHHLMRSQVQLDAVCVPWVLSVFTNLVDVRFLHLVYDGMIKFGWKFIYQLATNYFLYLKKGLMLSNDSSELLVQLSCSYANKHPNIPWQKIIESCGRITVPLQFLEF